MDGQSGARASAGTMMGVPGLPELQLTRQSDGSITEKWDPPWSKSLKINKFDLPTGWLFVPEPLIPVHWGMGPNLVGFFLPKDKYDREKEAFEASGEVTASITLQVMQTS